MINKPNEWEQNIIDNAVEYSIMEWRPLDKSTKTIVKTYDEAFYFEQMVDWISSGNQLPTTEEQTIKALGI